MNDKIRNHVACVCGASDEEDVVECIREARVVYSKIGCSHRWYDEEFVVVDIGGMLIGYQWYHTTGDMSASEMDLDFDVGSITEVEARQVVTTEYVSKGD